MSMNKTVNIRDDEGVRVICLSRPHRMNAFDLQLSCDLRDAVRDAFAAPAVRVLVLTGEGGNFCTGADLKRDRVKEAESGLDLLEVLHEAFVLLREGSKPSVAAIEGHAVGAGLSLALACDFLVASTSCRLSVPFTQVGLAPDLGITITLPERVGLGVARDMLLAGAAKNSEEARALGLVDQVCEPGSALSQAVERAKNLSRRAPLAMAAARRLLASRQLPSSDHHALEMELQRSLRGTADAAEAAQAFAQKRPPVFRGA